jgi:hypothetical protein
MSFGDTFADEIIRWTKLNELSLLSEVDVRHLKPQAGSPRAPLAKF